MVVSTAVVVAEASRHRSDNVGGGRTDTDRQLQAWDAGRRLWLSRGRITSPSELRLVFTLIYVYICSSF